MGCQVAGWKVVSVDPQYNWVVIAIRISQGKSVFVHTHVFVSLTKIPINLHINQF